MPVEPPASRWILPEPSGVDDVIAVGGDLQPGTILQGYRKGLFPMHLPDGRLAWWSPPSRGVLPLDGLKMSRSLRRSTRRFTTTIGEAFDDVVEGCADPDRPHGWITDEIADAYRALHRLGWAHSVETWIGSELVGGLYGVAIGGAFFGESMFHRRSDASKVALVRLVGHLRGCGATLLDVQWATEHLVSLGVMEIPRETYLEQLAEALARPGCFGEGALP
jgi:leucyl/phenylalanyl-tRNA--protein transferase